MNDIEKSQAWASHLATKRNHRQARKSSFDAGWDAALAVSQGEPSDAQVEAACDAFYNDPSDITQWNRLADYEGRIADKYRARMRAALRAAGGVR